LGLAAHDFASLAASRHVLLTRSLKENGAPAVASRWLLRIKQLAKGLGAESALEARKDLLRWARIIDISKPEPRVPRAAPCPPVAARPRSLSITEIETWLRDPYAIYGKHILRLKPVDPLDEEPGPPERGTAIHDALERFLRAYPNALPADAFIELLRFGDEAFAKAGATDAVLALWRPRFARAARWFLAYERERRTTLSQTLVEMKGMLEIPARDKFTLRGRADRIDFFADGSASVLDYKTGRVPTDKQIKQLLSPQLPLEGAMLMMGAFGEARARALCEFIHIRLTGGEPPGQECVADVDADSKAMEALSKLTTHVERYDNPLQPYRSREMPFRLSDVGDYDHLARVREWTLEREDDE
jgi:ATP-dependent helicase/nuclease subunit B